jgi:hypothetical protein
MKLTIKRLVGDYRWQVSGWWEGWWEGGRGGRDENDGELQGRDGNFADLLAVRRRDGPRAGSASFSLVVPSLL